jgi:hypothetical protein
MHMPVEITCTIICMLWELLPRTIFATKNLRSTSVTKQTISIADCDEHTHVLWFGFTFTLPAHNESQGADDELLRGVGLQFVPPNCESVVNVMLNDVSSPFVMPPLERASRSAFVQANGEQSFVTPVISAPLCDTARHERSGAQII